MMRSVDEPEAHYYPDPNGDFPIGPGDDALTYDRLVKHVQQAGEHAMIHSHAEDADVFCMDYDCELWKPWEEGLDTDEEWPVHIAVIQFLRDPDTDDPINWDWTALLDQQNKVEYVTGGVMGYAIPEEYGDAP